MEILFGYPAARLCAGQPAASGKVLLNPSMDSRPACRYAQVMRFLHVCLLLASLTAVVVPLRPAQAADTPVLARLEYRSGWFTKSAKIYASPGAANSPFAGKPQVQWILRSGDVLKQPTPPPESLIQLYQMAGNDLRVLCTITVKYTRDPKGWRPAFLLNPQPLVSWDGHKLVPITTDDAARGQIQIVQTATPDGEGFYPAFVFNFSTGPMQIDAWAVQQ